MALHGYEPQLKRLSRRIDDLRSIQYSLRKRMSDLMARFKFVEQEVEKVRAEMKNERMMYKGAHGKEKGKRIRKNN